MLWLPSSLSLALYPESTLAETLIRHSPALAMELPLDLLIALVAGIVVQILYLALPAVNPDPTGGKTPFYARTLKAQVLCAFFPLAAVIGFTLFYTVNTTAISVVLRTVVNQADNDATTIARSETTLFDTGRQLVTQYAGQEPEWVPNDAERGARLERYFNTMPFFDRVSIISPSFELLSSFPAITGTETSAVAAAQQQAAQQSLLTKAASVSLPYDLGGEAYLAFCAPITSGSDTASSVFVGEVALSRTALDQSLVDWVKRENGQEKGFIVDSRNIVVVHPDASQLLTHWVPPDSVDGVVTGVSGQAFVRADPDGTRWLTYVSSPTAMGWKTVFQIPYAQLVGLYSSISTPVIAVGLILGVVIAGLILVIVPRFVRPIETLSQAASQIAAGRLDVRIDVAGDDEIGRLGLAFERMRIRLRKQLSEFALLLRISRAVSAHPSLPRSLKPVLSGVLQGTSASCARVILLSAEGKPQQEMISRSFGHTEWRDSSAFDDQLLKLLENRRAIRVRDTSIYPHAFCTEADTAVGFPIAVNSQLAGVLWAEYARSGDFVQEDIEFLGTLAGQVAVAIQSARLFEAVERERRRLAGILNSTGDAILVTDSRHTLVLSNPAASTMFCMDVAALVGQCLDTANFPTPILEMLNRLSSSKGTITRTFETADWRTLYTTAAAIRNESGESDGYVVVVRDITDLTRAERQKSELVTTVTHDLRSPLTALTGYASLLEGSEPLTDAQSGFIGKIRVNISRMTEMIDDLVDLGKIEAGVDVQMRECDIRTLLVQVTDQMKTLAQAKQLSFRVDAPAGLPTHGRQCPRPPRHHEHCRQCHQIYLQWRRRHPGDAGSRSSGGQREGFGNRHPGSGNPQNL